MAQDQATILMFPGLDGTGRLFVPLLGELPEVLVPQVVQYPTDRALGYDELVTYASALIPRRRKSVLLGESFSGPLVLQLAARQPEGLIAVILVASFHRRPIPRLLSGLLRPFVSVAFSRPTPVFAARYGRERPERHRPQPVAGRDGCAMVPSPASRGPLPSTHGIIGP